MNSVHLGTLHIEDSATHAPQAAFNVFLLHKIPPLLYLAVTTCLLFLAKDVINLTILILLKIVKSAQLIVYTVILLKHVKSALLLIFWNTNCSMESII